MSIINEHDDDGDNMQSANFQYNTKKSKMRHFNI